jgi:Polysaccharide deacetylase
MTEPSGRPVCAVHLDLDGYSDICRVHGWTAQTRRDALNQSGMYNALEFFSKQNIPATMFAIAQDVRSATKAENLRDAISAGHEIASHSITHRKLTGLSSAEKRKEIAESKAMLEQALGVRVRGFRAPEFAIDTESLRLLETEGYDFDSSLFPNRKTPARPHTVHPGGTLMELPLPAHAPLPLPFHPSYSLVLGNWYFKTGLRQSIRQRLPLVLLFHLTDFADPVPDQDLPNWTAGVYTLSFLSQAEKLRRCTAMLEFVQRHYRIVSTTEFIESQAGHTEEALKAGNRA